MESGGRTQRDPAQPGESLASFKEAVSRGGGAQEHRPALRTQVSETCLWGRRKQDHLCLRLLAPASPGSVSLSELCPV